MRKRKENVTQNGAAEQATATSGSGTVRQRWPPAGAIAASDDGSIGLLRASLDDLRRRLAALVASRWLRNGLPVAQNVRLASDRLDWQATSFSAHHVLQLPVMSSTLSRQNWTATRPWSPENVFFVTVVAWRG